MLSPFCIFRKAFARSKWDCFAEPFRSTTESLFPNKRIVSLGQRAYNTVRFSTPCSKAFFLEDFGMSQRSIHALPLQAVGFVILFCLLTDTSNLQGQSLNEQSFAKLHAELQTSPDAIWRSIPWKLSLLEAQAEAARTSKPIFIWAMDGHPCGCT